MLSTRHNLDCLPQASYTIEGETSGRAVVVDGVLRSYLRFTACPEVRHVPA